jgi:hypothetical protein
MNSENVPRPAGVGPNEVLVHLFRSAMCTGDRSASSQLIETTQNPWLVTFFTIAI